MTINASEDNLRKCIRCGEVLPDEHIILCPQCGSAQPIKRSPDNLRSRQYGPRTSENNEGKSDKSRKTALIICIFTGAYGGHRFYTGHITSGILQLLTFGGLGVWWILDLISIATGNFTDIQGRLLYKTDAERKAAIIRDKEETRRKIEGGFLKKYSVLYLGGFPGYTSNLYNVNLIVKKDCFLIESDIKQRPINFCIDYSRVSNVEIVARQVSTIESVLGGLDSRQLNQDNNIHITYTDENGLELVVRLEMITGVSVMGQARECREFMDLLRINGIPKLFQGANTNTTSSSA